MSQCTAKVTWGNTVSVSVASAGGGNIVANVAGGSPPQAASGVESVNGKAGTVTLNAADVSAAVASHTHVAADVTDFVAQASKVGPVSSVNGQAGTVSLSVSDLTAAAASHTHVAADVTDFSSQASKVGPVSSVNGVTGTVILTSVGVSAASAVHTHVAANITDFAAEAAKVGPVASVAGLTGVISIAAGQNVTVSTAANSITITAGGGGGDVASVNGQTGVVSLSTADLTAAAALHASQHNTGGSDALANVVTAVSITASANDYALPVGDIFRLSHTATVTLNITGLATALDGEAKLLINVSTGASSAITLRHADTNSTAVSRFLVPWEGDYVMSPKGGAALVIYDSTDSRWRVV
jgi:hypothetical protein